MSLYSSAVKNFHENSDFKLEAFRFEFQSQFFCFHETSGFLSRAELFSLDALSLACSVFSMLLTYSMLEMLQFLKLKFNVWLLMTLLEFPGVIPTTKMSKIRGADCCGGGDEANANVIIKGDGRLIGLELLHCNCIYIYLR